MFCPKCRSLMMPTVQNGKRVLKCTSCAFMQVGEMSLKSEGTKTKEMHVIEKETDVRVLVDHPCPKCKNDKSRHWTLQTRGADEPETRFYECETCKYTWREYK
ncbi:MAG: transcription factor S [Nanoarchaeota archaeon]